MSKDFVVFDPTGIEMPSDKQGLLDWIHDKTGDGTQSSPDNPSSGISQLLIWACERYGSTVSEDSIWASWPPSLLANGRHCTFNLCLGADGMTFMMDLSEQCKNLGLIMIDPSGRDPFITIPGGGGILD